MKCCAAAGVLAVSRMASGAESMSRQFEPLDSQVTVGLTSADGELLDLASEVLALRPGQLARTYVIRGLVMDGYKVHPAQRLANPVKA